MVRWRVGWGVILIISLYYDFYSYCMQQAPIYKQCVWLSYMCCRLYVRGRPISTYLYIFLDVYIYIERDIYVLFFCVLFVLTACPWCSALGPKVAVHSQWQKEQEA